MEKYEVNDRVEVIEIMDAEKEGTSINIGSTGIVTEVDDTLKICNVRFDDVEYDYKTARFLQDDMTYMINYCQLKKIEGMENGK